MDDTDFIVQLALLGKKEVSESFERKYINYIHLIIRVRTGYGILEKLWNFEKEIPYMEKLWNLSKRAVPMEKLWNFPFCGKKCVLSLKNGGKIRPHFTRPSSTNLPGYSASLGRVNTC